MGEFRQFQYSKTSDEIEFMQGLIDIICGLAGDITCEDEAGNPTTAAEQYADLSSESTAKFYINFGNSNNRVLIQRASNNSATQKYFSFDGQNIEYSRNYTAPSQIDTRTVGIFYYKSDNMALFGIASNGQQPPQITNRAIMLIDTENDERFFVHFAGNNFLAQSLNSGTMTISFYTILPYSAGAGNIDYIEKSVFISGGVRALFIPDIFSCSTIAQWSTIALPDGRNFIALGTNAMIEIEDPST